MRFLIWLLIGYAIYRMVKGKREEALPGPEARRAAETVQDPVCGVYVSEDDAVVGVLEGKRYYFCSRQCLDRFQEQISESATANKSGGNG